MKKLYYNGDIITMEGENDYVEAILTSDKIIEKAGSLQEIISYSNKQNYSNKKIDLNGKTMLPSFIDAHSHISMVAQTSWMADLKECKNFSEILKVMNKYKKSNNFSKNDLIVGFGYDHNFLKENEHPKKDLLNKISINNPVFIIHTSVHMAVANDKGLKWAGIDEDTPDSQGGKIGRIKESREPNGYLEEDPFMKIRPKIFQNPKFDQFNLAKKAQDIYLKNGITTVQDGLSSESEIKLFKKLAKNNQLKVDIVSYPDITSDLETIKSENKNCFNKYFNNFKIGGYKMILDGSPQGKSAWLTEPYQGEEDYRGYSWYSDQEVQDFIKKAFSDNQQLLTHCNGDAAADQLLRNYKKIKDDYPVNKKLRPVMIHSQLVRNDQLDEMSKLAMIPSMFVDHTYYWGDVHLKNFGDKRARRIDPARSALDKKLKLTFHQDAPIVKSDMLHTIWSAVNRKTRSGKNLGPEEQISVYEALKAVTINAAYQYFEEKNKGSIKEGKVADLVIISENPMKVRKEKIKDIKVLETIKNGKSIYKMENGGE